MKSLIIKLFKSSNSQTETYKENNVDNKFGLRVRLFEKLNNK